jgi:uncharacterized membrane protein
MLMRHALPLWSLVALILPRLAGADEPIKKYQVISPKDDGIIATGINGRGEIVGFEWIEEKARPGVLDQVPFYAKGKEITYLPLLKGYTATFPAAVSDDGTVVGRSSKPAPQNVRVPLRNQAFVWDARGGMRGLGVLPDDWASLACGITRDGRRISGFSVGDNRVRACVWDRQGDTWMATALPHHDQLGTQQVVISDDGKHIAGVDGTVAVLWSEGPGGKWTREVISPPGKLIPRGVNNAGTVAGLYHTGDGMTHAAIRSREAGYRTLEKPEGYVKSEAGAINNHGVVVGMIDGPSGSKIGPRAFVYESGKLRILEEGGPYFAAATAINDRGQVAGVLEKEEDEAAHPAEKDHVDTKKAGATHAPEP